MGVLNNSASAVFCLLRERSTYIKITMSINADEVKKICDIYDWDGKGVLDMYYFMDIFYALGLNIIKKVCVKYGQTDDYGKKFCKFDEVVSLMQQAIKEPDNKGNYHDYVELCKLYDKNENGTMMLAELENSCPTWVMRSPRKTLSSSSKSWPTRRTRMVSFPTNPSWTGSAARPKLKIFAKILAKISPQKQKKTSTDNFKQLNSVSNKKQGGQT